MPDRKLTFDFIAKDDLTGTFQRVAGATEKLKAKLDAIAAKATNIKISADDKDAQAKVLDIQAKLIALGKRTANPRIDAAGTARAEAEIAKLDAQLDAFGHKRETATVRVKTDSSQLDSLFSKLAKIGGGSGGALSSGVALATVAPAIGLIGATALPALAGLAGGLTAAGAGAGAFALVAVPAYKKIQTASTNLAKAQDAVTKATTNKARQKALKDEKSLLDALSPSEKTAVQNYNDFTGALHGFEKNLEPAAFSVIGNGFGLITDNLPKIVPLATGAAGAINGLITDARNGLKDPFWTQWSAWLDKTAPASISAFGTAAGDVATGVAGLIQAVSPETNAAEAELDKLSGKFSAFGQKAAAGESPAFDSFITFADDTGPKASRLITDITKALAPIVGAIAAQLPGVLSSLDRMVTKSTPFFDALGKDFVSGAAKTIEDIAGAIGQLAADADKLPPGVLHDAGVALGVIAALKFTGLLGLVGTLGKVGGAAAGAEGSVGLLGFALDGLVWPVALTAGAIGFQKLIDKTIPSMKTIDDTAKSTGWTAIAKAGAHDQVDDTAKSNSGLLKSISNGPAGDIAEANRGLLGSISSIFGGGKSSPTVTLHIKDLATPVLKSVNRSVDDYAKQHPDVALSAKDQASSPAKRALKSVQLFTHSPAKTFLEAQDHATGVAQAAARHLELFTRTPTRVSLKAKDNASSVVWSTQKNIDRLAGKSVSLHADVSGLGAVESLNSQIAALHSKEVTLTTRVQTIQLQTVHSAAPGVGHAVANADGGKIRGTGGPTSDSNLSWVSNGEWVINARRSAELGDRFMSWVNNGHGMSAYASGGKVPPKIPGTNFRTTAGLAGAGNHLIDVILSSLSGGRAQSTIKAVDASIIKSIDADFTGASRSGLVNFTQRVNSQMAGLAQQRSAIANKLAKANDLSTTVKQGAASFADITGLDAGSPAYVGNQLRSKLTAINHFSSNLMTLQKRGFSRAFLDQLVNAGIDQGAPIAASLVKSTPAQIHSLNATERALTRASSGLATASVNAEFGSSAATSFTAGLKREEASLDKQMSQLAKVFARGVGKAFHIKGYASGGYIAPGEIAVVGEGGNPEIVQGGRAGATVTPVHGRAAGVGGVSGAELAQMVGDAVSAAVNGAELTLHQKSGRVVASLAANPMNRRLAGV